MCQASNEELIWYTIRSTKVVPLTTELNAKRRPVQHLQRFSNICFINTEQKTKDKIKHKTILRLNAHLRM